MDTTRVMELTEPATLTSKIFDLPTEVRLQIYEEYFWSQCHPSAKSMHEELLPKRCTDCEQLLLVNKQMYEEVMDFLRRQTTFTYRISWQESMFDKFAILCSKARRPEMLLARKHIRVEIYPPHRDRPTNMVQIWRQVEGFCRTVGSESCWPEHLSVIFMENEIASWSDENGISRESVDLYGPWNGESPYSDVGFILDVFGILHDIKAVSIHLPVSCADEEDLQEKKSDIEEKMRAPFQCSKRMKSQVAPTKRQFDWNEQRLKEETGQKSMEKLSAISTLRQVSSDELEYLKQIWLHADIFPKNDDDSSSNGDENSSSNNDEDSCSDDEDCLLSDKNCFSYSADEEHDHYSDKAYFYPS